MGSVGAGSGPGNPGGPGRWRYAGPAGRLPGHGEGPGAPLPRGLPALPDGCIAALKTLEITCRPEIRSMVFYIADLLGRGLRRIQQAYPDWFTGVRQDGLVMGLEFDHPQGAKFVMKRLYEHGVWAIFSTLDPRVLPWEAPVGMVAPYPVASNVRDEDGWPPAGRTPGRNGRAATGGPALPAAGAGPDMEALRAEIRRVVLEELRGIVGGQGG